MNSDWRPFAQRLTTLAEAEGQSDFLTKIFHFLNDFVIVDSCAVFKIAADKTTGAEHLCTFGNLNPELSDLLAEDYIRNGFRNDPMVKTALTSTNARVRHIPGSQYPSEYRSQYFEKAGLIDKVSSTHVVQNVIFLVSFYRLKGHGTFDSRDFKDLQQLAPILGRFVLRHFQTTRKVTIPSQSLSEKIKSVINDNTQTFSKLSPKEREVCEAILMGTSEANIAKAMGLTKHTVVSYRRRIYAKLNLSSKPDLFKLLLMTLP